MLSLGRDITSRYFDVQADEDGRSIRHYRQSQTYVFEGRASPALNHVSSVGSARRKARRIEKRRDRSFWESKVTEQSLRSELGHLQQRSRPTSRGAADIKYPSIRDQKHLTHRQKGQGPQSVGCGTPLKLRRGWRVGWFRLHFREARSAVRVGPDGEVQAFPMPCPALTSCGLACFSLRGSPNLSWPFQAGLNPPALGVAKGSLLFCQWVGKWSRQAATHIPDRIPEYCVIMSQTNS